MGLDNFKRFSPNFALVAVMSPAALKLHKQLIQSIRVTHCCYFSQKDYKAILETLFVCLNLKCIMPFHSYSFSLSKTYFLLQIYVCIVLGNSYISIFDFTTNKKALNPFYYILFFLLRIIRGKRACCGTGGAGIIV